MNFEKFTIEKQRLTTALNLTGVKVVMVACYENGQMLDKIEEKSAISFLGNNDLDLKVDNKLYTEIEYFLQCIIDHHGKDKNLNGGSIIWSVKEGEFSHTTYEVKANDPVGWPVPNF